MPDNKLARKWLSMSKFFSKMNDDYNKKGNAFIIKKTMT